jgi:hypothetical protein
VLFAEHKTQNGTAMMHFDDAAIYNLCTVEEQSPDPEAIRINYPSGRVNSIPSNFRLFSTRKKHFLGDQYESRVELFVSLGAFSAGLLRIYSERLLCHGYRDCGCAVKVKENMLNQPDKMTYSLSL